MNVSPLGRRVLVLLIVLSTGLVLFAPATTATAKTPPEEEPNDSPETATGIESGTTVTGEISARDDEDWFAFEAEAGESANLTGEIGPGPGIFFKLTDGDGNVIATVRGSDQTVSSGFTVTETDTYYLRVHHWTGDGSAEYSFEIETFRTTDREPNEGPDSATAISVEETISDVIPNRHDEDWYAFEAEAGETINVSADIGPGAGLKFRVVDPDRNRVGGTRGSNTTVVGGVTAKQSGTYYLQVPHWTGSGSTDYSFEIRTDRTSENEPNENRTIATQLTLNASVEDTISLGDTDWYAFDLEEGDSISVRGTVSSAGGNNFNIRGPEDNILNGTQVGDGSFRIDATAPGNGTHYLTVSQSSAPGADYTLDVRTNGTASQSDENGQGDPDESGDGGAESDADDGDSGGLPVVPVGLGLVVVLLVVVFLWRRERDGKQPPGQ